MTLQLMVRRDNDSAVGFYRSPGYDVVDAVVLGRRQDGGGS